MNKDKYVFAQLVGFLDNFKFLRIVKKYDGDKYVKSYTCWNQLLTLMFGQLSNRESLRDLIVAMGAHAGKLYHLGIGKSVTRSNLSKANEQRDYHIFEEFAFFMIAEARRRRIQKIFELDGHIYAFDSTTIDLCLSVFEWAKFRKHKGGVKMHTLYDVEAQVPAFVHITPAKVHDTKAMSEVPYEAGGTTSSTVATTISVICTLSTVSARSLSSERKPMSDSSLRLGNGGFLQMWFLMQSVTSRFIKARRIIRKSSGR